MTDMPNPDPEITAAADAPAAGNPPEKRASLVYRAPSAGLLPSYVRLLAVLTALAALWLAVEVFWPERAIVSLDFAPAAASDAPAVDSSPRDAGSFDSQFAYRKLFIPEVAVESRETSRATVQQLLDKLTLSGLVETDGELCAWVQVREGAPDARSPRYASSTASSAAPQTSLKLVKKGDMLLDFEVVEITRDGVTLSLAGFTETLR